MPDRFSGSGSALILPQSKAVPVRHRDAYGFRIPTRLCGKGGVLHGLKTHSPWVQSSRLKVSRLHIGIQGIHLSRT